MRILLLVSVFTMLVMTGSSYAMFEGKGKTGVFCMIKKVEVCVIARDEGDCTKIGGQKVESCSKEK